MTDWDRVQKLELELAQAQAAHRRLVGDVARLMGERDRARATACSLEQELAACENEFHRLSYLLAEQGM